MFGIRQGHRHQTTLTAAAQSNLSLVSSAHFCITARAVLLLQSSSTTYLARALVSSHPTAICVAIAWIYVPD